MPIPAHTSSTSIARATKRREFTLSFQVQGFRGSEVQGNRYTFDRSSQTLTAPIDVLDGLPAWDDHGGGRLLVGPDRMLYLTRGDQGNNWLANACHAIRSQELPTAGEIRDRDWSKYQGKILRLNLDESIPGDNPVINGVRRGIATSRSVPMVSASTPDDHGPTMGDRGQTAGVLANPGAILEFTYVAK